MRIHRARPWKAAESSKHRFSLAVWRWKSTRAIRIPPSLKPPLGRRRPIRALRGRLLARDWLRRRHQQQVSNAFLFACLLARLNFLFFDDNLAVWKRNVAGNRVAFQFAEWGRRWAVIGANCESLLSIDCKGAVLSHGGDNYYFIIMNRTSEWWICTNLLTKITS